MVKRRRYQYESRHLHAMRRLRTKTGRFLTRKEREALERGEFTIETLPMDYNKSKEKSQVTEQVVKNITKRLQRKQQLVKEYLKARENAQLLLIPVRIAEENITDCFLWNLYESNMTPKQFVEMYCKDLNLHESMQAPILEVLEEQIEKYKNLISKATTDTTEFKVEESEKDELFDNNLLVEIKLNVRVGGIVLRDKFEWDISCVDNDPVQFAKTLCHDLGLHQAFVPLIAHQIYERIYKHIERILSGERESPKERSIMEDLEKPEDVLRERDEHEEWAPQVEQLSKDEMEKIARKEERAMRYRRRHGKGSIEALPTSIPSITTRRRSRQANPIPNHYVQNQPPNYTPTTAANNPLYQQLKYDRSAPTLDNCINCGTSRADTPVMRRGPDGNKSLCNKCGLAWVTGRLKL